MVKMRKKSRDAELDPVRSAVKRAPDGKWIQSWDWEAEQAKAERIHGPLVRKGLWNIYRDGVTQGFIKTFLACRKQCELKFVDGWTPRETGYALEWGCYFHHQLELAHSAGKKPTDEQVRKRGLAYEKDWKGFTRLNPENEGSETFEKRNEEERELCLGTVEAVLPPYFSRWAKDWDGTRKWEATEQRFRVPIHLPGKGSDNITIPVRGMIDGLYRENKRLNQLDTKTKGRMMDDDDFLLTLPFDAQMYLYATVVNEVLDEWPDTFIVDVVRNPQLKKHKTEPVQRFCKRCRDDAHDRPDHYFKRFNVALELSQLQAWRSAFLLPVLREIQMWAHGHTGTYINGDALAWGFRKCDHFDIIARGEYENFYKRKVVYRELE